MTDELRPYFEAILAAPEEDEPRLELARHLTDRGDGRGEHIRLACALDQLERDDPARAELVERAAKLPSFAFFTQVDRSFPHSYGVRRGFVEELSCSAADFATHAARLMRAAPIRVYDRTPYFPNQAAQLAACPALARLRRLTLPSDFQDNATILASPHLAGLRELELAMFLDDEAAVARLALELRHLLGLRVLSTHHGRIAGSACGALARLADGLRLELIDVRGANVSEAGVAELRANLGEGRVLPRPAPRVPFRFGVLDLGASRLETAELRGLIESGEFRTAVKLWFGQHQIGDGGVAHLARSGAFPSLVELHLGAGVTDRAASLLAREAVGLERLERLDLGEVPAEGTKIGARDGSGVGDAVVRALARSPRLPALRTISRSKEYRAYATGAREGPERISIERDDGSVVESVIHHSIWP